MVIAQRQNSFSCTTHKHTHTTQNTQYTYSFECDSKFQSICKHKEKRKIKQILLESLFTFGKSLLVICVAPHSFLTGARNSMYKALELLTCLFDNGMHFQMVRTFLCTTYKHRLKEKRKFHRINLLCYDMLVKFR